MREGELLRLLSRTLLSLIALLAGMLPSAAQCVNTAKPSCGVYKVCFAKYCPCAGNADEYFESYGLKYCERFLDAAGFSPAGLAWRDSTLSCLQESIVPKLDISAAPKCDCKSMKSFAFKSHVQCYTKPGNSICSLPVSDINVIRGIIDLKDVFNSDGWAQMKQVATICQTSAPDDHRKVLWNTIAAILAAK